MTSLGYDPNLLQDQGGRPGWSVVNAQQAHAISYALSEGSGSPTPWVEEGQLTRNLVDQGYDPHYLDLSWQGSAARRAEARAYDAEWRLNHLDVNTPTPHFGYDTDTARTFLALPPELREQVTNETQATTSFGQFLKDSVKDFLQGPAVVFLAAATAGYLAPAEGAAGGAAAAAGESSALAEGAAAFAGENITGATVTGAQAAAGGGLSAGSIASSIGSGALSIGSTVAKSAIASSLGKRLTDSPSDMAEFYATGGDVPPITVTQTGPTPKPAPILDDDTMLVIGGGLLLVTIFLLLRGGK